jgi:hypothetical protein
MLGFQVIAAICIAALLIMAIRNTQFCAENSPGARLGHSFLVMGCP